MGDDRLTVLGVKVELVQRLVVRMLQLSVISLLVATLLVPLARIDPEDSDESVQRVNLTGLVSLISEEDDSFIDSDDESISDSNETTAITGGLFLTRAGVILLIVGLLGTGFAALFVLFTSMDRRYTVIVRVGAAILLVAALVLAIGLRWLPEYTDGEIGPAWGVWVPLITGLGMLVLHPTARELDA